MSKDNSSTGKPIRASQKTKLNWTTIAHCKRGYTSTVYWYTHIWHI